MTTLAPLLRWQPRRELWFVLLTWFLVTGGLSLAFQVFTTRLVALNFITYGPITLFAFGLFLPVLWTLCHSRGLADLGVSRSRLWVSLIIGLVFGVIQYKLTLAKISLPPAQGLIPLVTMALAVGLFEAVFFRGWVQLRLEASFGWFAGLVLGAGMYALYHIGYGMSWDEIRFLFIIGLIYGAAFRLTKNIFIIWPLFTPSGGLFATVTDGLELPFEATYGFVLVLILMVGTLITVQAIVVRNKRIGEPPFSPT